MKDQDTKEQFIELRASGWSYARIARKLKVAKQTLISWSKEYEPQISNLRAIEIETLMEKYRVSKRKKIELFSKQLQLIIQELRRRDLSNVPTEKLFELLLKCNAALQNETDGVLQFSEREAFSGFEELVNGSISSWNP